MLLNLSAKVQYLMHGYESESYFEPIFIPKILKKNA